MAVPSELVGVEYLCQMIKLHPLQEILWAYLVLGGNSAHHANHSLLNLPHATRHLIIEASLQPSPEDKQSSKKQKDGTT